MITQVDEFVKAVRSRRLTVAKGDLARALQDYVNPGRSREFFEKLVSRRQLNQTLATFLAPRVPRKRARSESGVFTFMEQEPPVPVPAAAPHRDRVVTVHPPNAASVAGAGTIEGFVPPYQVGAAGGIPAMQPPHFAASALAAGMYHPEYAAYGAHAQMLQPNPGMAAWPRFAPSSSSDGGTLLSYHGLPGASQAAPGHFNGSASGGPYVYHIHTDQLVPVSTAAVAAAWHAQHPHWAGAPAVSGLPPAAPALDAGHATVGPAPTSHSAYFHTYPYPSPTAM